MKKVLSFIVSYLHSTIYNLDGSPYLERWVLIFFGLGGIRLHKFYSGDPDNGALHDHAWWFVTLPFTTYCEDYWDHERNITVFRFVEAFRLHFRSANFRHSVYPTYSQQNKPFWTIVVMGKAKRMWGFWPKSDKFVPWKEFSN